MKTTFNRITLDLPSDWEDNTLVTLLGPAPKSFEMPHHRAAAEPERPNLVLKRTPMKAREVTLEAFAAAQAEVMRSMAPDLKVAPGGTLRVGESDGIVQELTFSAPPRMLRQWQLYFYADDAFLMVCGTASNDAVFEQHRARFVAIAQSLRFGG